MITRKKILGLMAAPFTPMDKDGELNLSIVPQYYQMLKANGVTGAFICGSTGEGVSLSFEEKIQVAEAWINAKKGDDAFTVMLLLGGTCIKDCITLAKQVEQIGIDAVSFTSPFYFKPASVDQLADSCKAIADTVPNLPFYYYHIPVLNGCSISMISLLKKIDASVPNFAGIKYTHEDFMDFLSCLHYADGKYDMLWGRDENMLAALAVGAKGAVGSTFNYAAPLYYKLIKYFEENNLPDARKCQQQSIDMIELLGKYGGIATGKVYMKLMGIDCGGFRLPVNNMPAYKFKEFEAEAKCVGFNDFCSKLS
ncbi:MULTISPECIES: dihydrodipicolinate synthase family protein [Chitinophagaceae]